MPIKIRKRVKRETGKEERVDGEIRKKVDHLEKVVHLKKVDHLEKVGQLEKMVVKKKKEDLVKRAFH